ncbi:MAG: SusD/RagB family nutrient-binding outer membrane lipoprotein [Actinomycetota bacterium]
MKKTYRITALVMLLALISAGCSKFEELNTNPNTTTVASASMLCTRAILSVTAFSGRDGKVMISDNALPKYVGYANEGQLGTQYNTIGATDFSGLLVLPNIEQMLEEARGTVMENSYKGVASFVRAYLFFRITMETGDMPYSEANKGADGLYRPSYDTQEQIFLGILDELKAADQFFAQGVTFNGDPTPYNGDPDKWRRAVNATALKILMTLSKKENVTSLNVKSRFAGIVNAGYLLQPSTGFLGVNYSAQNKHPLSGTNDLFTSRTVLSSLLLDNLKLLNDRRMYYYAEPAAAQILAGLTQVDPEAYSGVDVSIDYATMNAGHSAGIYSLLNKRYLQEEATEPRRLITYAEQQLILAEARIRGWITTGTAQEYYEQGVKAALGHFLTVNSNYAHTMPVNQAYIDGYLTGEAAFKTVEEDQLKQIWMQRYLLNFMQDAQYSYFEYRRTSYPVFPINPATSLNENNPSGLPMRWLYPSSETNYNRENLIEALDRQYEGYDEINKLMWLLK